MTLAFAAEVAQAQEVPDQQAEVLPQVVPPPATTESSEPVAPGEPNAPVSEPAPEMPPAGPVQLAIQGSGTNSERAREAPPAAPVEPAPAPQVAVDGYPRFEPSLRLMTGFERTSERRFGTQAQLETDRYGFFLSQARAQLEGELTKRIELELSAELADAYDAGVVATGSKPRYLRDAFMNLRLKRAFQVTLGHFKRPLSALEQRNAGELQVRGRGLTNDLIVEDNAWGSRGLGLMLWGKIKPIRARWAVGAFDPAWNASPAARPKGADVLGRIGVELVEGLTVSANGGLKVLDTPPFEEYRTYYAGGADIALEMAGFSLLVDALYAQLPQLATGLEEQTAAGVVGLASYDVPVTRALELQPVLFGEYFDSSIDHLDSESLRVVFGLNWIVHEKLRIMPQAEIVHWLGEASELSPTEGTSLYVMVSLAF